MSEDLTKEQAVQYAIKLLSGNVNPEEKTQGMSSHQLALDLLKCANVDVSCSVDLDDLGDNEEIVGARVFGYCPMGLNDHNNPTILMLLESVNIDALEAIKKAEDKKTAKAWDKLSPNQQNALVKMSLGEYRVAELGAVTLRALTRKGLACERYTRTHSAEVPFLTKVGQDIVHNGLREQSTEKDRS